jgi:mannose-6-phosphate isomerase-like protein (cupin superfamily)
VTNPLLGKWNCTANGVTTGTTTFDPGRGIPLHSHNVEECVLVLEGRADVVVGTDEFEVSAGDLTWVPAGINHCFSNPGPSRLTIYWVYGGRDVTRTLDATGETIEHLSAADAAIATDAGDAS